MAAATAFFTTFSLPAILLIIIQLFGLLVNRTKLDSRLMNTLAQNLGNESAEQISNTLINLHKLALNWYVTVGGFLFLMFVATTLFTIIKNTFNEIWQLKVKSHPGILFYLKTRGRSLLAIFAAGILFLIGLLTEGLEILLGKYTDELLPGAGIFLQGTLNEIIAAVIFTAWFVVVFRFLADGRPSWRAALAGGIVTGVLFTIGQLLLKFFLSNSNIGTVYGASGSIVLLLLFVFYSSFILYFGAAFIKVYSDSSQHRIVPVNQAYHYKLEETE